MIGTITLCILSTLAFCLCARSTFALATANRVVSWKVRTRGFSASAYRVARTYATFALGSLTVLAFAGMVSSYLELFGF